MSIRIPKPGNKQTQALACVTNNLEDAIKAALLYVGEYDDYYEVISESDEKAIVKTKCHKIDIEWDTIEQAYSVTIEFYAIPECVGRREEIWSDFEKRMQEIEQAYNMCKPK